MISAQAFNTQASSDELVTMLREADAANDPDTREKALQKLLGSVWRQQSHRTKRAFVARLGIGPEYSLTDIPTLWPALEDPLLEAAARNWAYLEDELEHKQRDFWRSIKNRLWGHRINYDWTPSEKQASYMKRLYSDWVKCRGIDPDSQVMEGGAAEK